MPFDYTPRAVDVLPSVGRRRMYTKWDVNVQLLHDSTMEVMYMRQDEPMSLHVAVRSGSQVKVGDLCFINTLGQCANEYLQSVLVFLCLFHCFYFTENFLCSY